MSETIRAQILGYANLEKFFREKSSPIKPYSIKETVDILGDSITGYQQVHDFVKKHYDKDNLARIREAKAYKYWWRENTSAPPTKVEKVEKIEKEITPTTEIKEIPEIKVNSRENFVSIKTPSCKITIEY